MRNKSSTSEDESSSIIPPTNHRQLTRRIFPLSLQAIINAIIIGFVAKGMVLLIYLFTNLSFYGRFSFASASPSLEHVGNWVIVIPVIGALIIGLIARFGSRDIRGHGFPETIEKILGHESRIAAKLTFLKPLSAAISIGTGGPFGAEGPIIATGGAFGSLAGQIMKISDNERKIMLVAGSCAGLAAIFGSPIAGVLMAIELLLYEYSPRSIVPVALACATAAVMHLLLFGSQPVFAMPFIPEPTNLALLIYLIMGFILGIAGAYATKFEYGVEDFFATKFKKIHWMWWPAMGAIVVGVIGLIAPETMGIGYENIRQLLSGQVTLQIILGLSFLKFISWAIYLGSGTSGSTLAPLFTIGGALGALLGYLTLRAFPGCEINMATCALIGMAATFTGASRAILTAIVFSFETTSQPHGLLPLIIACAAAYLISFFLMKGTLYTKKVERLGIHAPTSFKADVLEMVLVKDVLKHSVNVLSQDNTIEEARDWIKENVADEESTAFAVINKEEQLVGVVKRKDILSKQHKIELPISILIKGKTHFIYPNNELSLAVDIMDQYQTDIVPVVKNGKDKEVIGILTHKAIFSAYHKRRNEEEIYERSPLFKGKGIQIIDRGKQWFSRHHKK